MSKIKTTVLRIPILGYLIQIGWNVLSLPRSQHRLFAAAHRQSIATDSVNDKVTRANLQIIEIKETNESFASEIVSMHRTVSSINNAMADFQKNHIVRAPHKQESPGRIKTLADDHSLDSFYVEFENKFRGSESEVLERLNVYLPYFKKLPASLNKKPVLDIGCGRGEFLQLMHDHKIKALGLDLNEAMVKQSKSKGFDTIQDDALDYMANQKEGSFSAITGFHLIEHIPFTDLMELFKGCYQALGDGGFVLFETPNPENVSVGAFSFYYDPSHLRPIPPKFIEFCLDYVGFREVSIIPLHPAIETKYEDKVMDAAMKKLFGPQDYAVIGYK